jgi:hypothetical protein
MHFDGIQWTEVEGQLGNMPDGCNAIYGITKDDYWVAELGSIVHYKDGTWAKYILNENLLVLGLTGYLGNIYAIAYDISQTGNGAFIFLIKNNQIIQIDETTITDLGGSYNGKFEPSKLFVNNGKLFTAWHKISSTTILPDGKIDQNGWHSILSLPSGQFFINTFYYNKKNILIVGYPSLLFHFNGTDWAKIDINVPNHTVDPYAIFWGVWTNGKEVFISDTENGIVYHGR